MLFLGWYGSRIGSGNGSTNVTLRGLEVSMWLALSLLVELAAECMLLEVQDVVVIKDDSSALVVP